MFDDDDPLLARVRALAGALPGALEKISHGHPAFYTKKVFAYDGGSLKQEGAWVQHRHSLTVLPDESDRRVCSGPRVYVPAYLGPSGWIGVDLDGSTDWDEMAELLDASYRLTAPKRLIVELDAVELSRTEGLRVRGHRAGRRVLHVGLVEHLGPRRQLQRDVVGVAEVDGAHEHAGVHLAARRPSGCRRG